MGRPRTSPGVTTTFGDTTTTLVADLAYEPSGMPNAMAFNDAAAPNVDNRYDPAGRLKASNPDTANARTYQYDANGNQARIDIAAAPWQSQRLGYDQSNRLTGAMGDYGFKDWTYDLTGNRLTQTHNGVESTYSYVTGTSRIDRIAPPAKPISSTATTITATPPPRAAEPIPITQPTGSSASQTMT